MYFSVHMDKSDLLYPGIMTSEHIIPISNLVKRWVSVPKWCMNSCYINPLNAELNPICCLLALLGAHPFLHVSRIRVKSLTHHHHISLMELGHLLTHSGLTYPEVSSKVCHDSFCQLGNSVSLPLG